LSENKGLASFYDEQFFGFDYPNFYKNKVVKLELTSLPYKVWLDEGGCILTWSIILATGTSPKWLNILEEDKFKNKSIFTDLRDAYKFEEKKLLIVGEGKFANTIAFHLYNKVSKNLTLVRRTEGPNDLILNNVMVHVNFQVKKLLTIDCLGENCLYGVELIDYRTNETKEIPCDAIFLSLERTPRTELLKGLVKLDSFGYPITKNVVCTSIPGVFVCGSMMDSKYKRIEYAKGTACQAALECKEWLYKMDKL
jgi:thioredoxin reductase (NADPH)